MTDLEAIINYWQTTLDHHSHLLDPSVLYIIETTIKNLKLLQEKLAHE